MSPRPFLSRRWAWLLVPLALGLAGMVSQRALYEVPILMYHHVAPVPEGSSVHVSPESFERQMEFLKVHGYRVVSLEQVLEDIRSGRPIPLNTVSITFDDGNLDNFQNAFPLLRKMGFPATVFMITSNIGREGWLAQEDLNILSEAGVSLGSHTATHAFLPEKTAAETEAELVRSKETLEKALGHSVTLFSYPAGGVTPQIRRQVEEAGYEGAVTTNYGHEKHDPFQLHRIKIKESSGNLFNFWLKLSGYYHLGKKRVDHDDGSE